MNAQSSASGSSRCTVVIPARLGSTRLPRKLLLKVAGKSVLQHTWEAVVAAKLPSQVLVAVDDLQLAEEVTRFGGTPVMTSRTANSGTDRVAEVAQNLDADFVINVQGDEPEMVAEAIDSLAATMFANPQMNMATLATPIHDMKSLSDPACVKVVMDATGKALYFSRSAIPHPRDEAASWLQKSESLFFQHLGIYAYRRQFLLDLVKMPPSNLEQIEKLEQLRVLEAGHSIHVAITEHAARGIDTDADFAAFAARKAG